ncbi:MAG: RusA family crossover junction endodeoxyribonuclease [Pseudomonadota bacterium]|nr:RusA family crossover junction endodeoxyribonuclease [Pseudomonadota bacterium]
MTTDLLGVVYEFHADLNPCPWKAPTLGTKRFGAKVVPSAAPNAEMLAYQEAIREAWEADWGVEALDCPVELTWTFARKLGAYKSPGGRTVHKKACDLSNLVKSSEDAIQPWLITNDRNVMRFSATWDRQAADVEGYVHLLVKPLERG